MAGLRKFALCLFGLLLQATYLSAQGQEDDPCIESRHLDNYHDSWRQVTNARETTARCDRYLDTAWYRFHMDNGIDVMPTYNPGLGWCGTNFPIWANGTLPSSSSDGIVTLKACAPSPFEDCKDSWEIRVKNCDGYFVYYLRDTPGCDMAYCIGYSNTTATPGVSTSTTTVLSTSAAVTTTGRGQREITGRSGQDGMTSSTRMSSVPTSIVPDGVVGTPPGGQSWMLPVIVVLVVVLLLGLLIVLVYFFVAKRRNKTGDDDSVKSLEKLPPGDESIYYVIDEKPGCPSDDNKMNNSYESKPGSGTTRGTYASSDVVYVAGVEPYQKLNNYMYGDLMSPYTGLSEIVKEKPEVQPEVDLDITDEHDVSYDDVQNN